MTVYELRISDWSSDVFSSDLDHPLELAPVPEPPNRAGVPRLIPPSARSSPHAPPPPSARARRPLRREGRSDPSPASTRPPRAPATAFGYFPRRAHPSPRRRRRDTSTRPTYEHVEYPSSIH